MRTRRVTGLMATLALIASCGVGVDGGGRVSTQGLGENPTSSAVAHDSSDAAITTTIPDLTTTTVRLFGWEPPLLTFGGDAFFGEVVRVEFDPEWSMSDGVAVSVGAIADTRVGPATLFLADGRTLRLPPGTPGGNNCIELIRPEDWRAITGFENPTPAQLASLLPPYNCFIYGVLRPDGALAWFNVAREFQRGDPTAQILTPPIAVFSSMLVIDGGLGLAIAPDVEVDCGNTNTIGAWLADADVLLSRTYVEINTTTGEAQRLFCLYGF